MNEKMPRPKLVRNISKARMLPRDSLVMMAAIKLMKISSRKLGRTSIRIEGRHIGFTEPGQFYEIERLDDLPTEEILATWFTSDECSDMKNDAYSCASAVDAGHEDADGRGLEHLTEEGAWLSYKARKDAYNVVLGEIEDQQATGKPVDWDKVARLYTEEAANNYREAAIRAKQDEEEAKRLHAEQPEEDSRVSSISQSSIPSLASSAVSDDSRNESEITIDLKKDIIQETSPVDVNNKAATPAVAPPRQPSLTGSVVESNSDTAVDVPVVDFGSVLVPSHLEPSTTASDDDHHLDDDTSTSSSASVPTSSSSSSSSSSTDDSDDSDSDTDDSAGIKAAAVAARKPRLKKAGFEEISLHIAPRRGTSAVDDAQAKVKAAKTSQNAGA